MMFPVKENIPIIIQIIPAKIRNGAFFGASMLVDKAIRITPMAKKKAAVVSSKSIFNTSFRLLVLCFKVYGCQSKHQQPYCKQVVVLVACWRDIDLLGDCPCTSGEDGVDVT